MGKIHIYICPNGCSYGDTNDRCRRCGEWKLDAGYKTMEEVDELNKEITLSKT